ncbi:TPA: phosphoethanolamine transferase, partial [Neisseria gonorrhoeae]
MMKKSLFVLFLYSSLLTASEIAYRFVFGIETLPAAKMAETFALTFMIAALYLFARYKASRLLIAVFFAFSMIANNVHYAVYQSWMTGINYWLMLKEVTEVGSAGAS